MRPRSEFLFQHLRDRHDLAQLTAELEPPLPFPRADKYLNASALQKAIRRGDLVIARRAAHQLYALDRPRLFRRIAVIGLEDVGIGSVDVAIELIGIATIPAARRVLGGDLRAIDIAVTLGCKAAKERSADWLGSIANGEPVDQWDQIALRSASPNALLAMIGASHLPWKRRLRAALIAAGRSGDDALQTCAPGIDAVLDVVAELGVPLPLIVACEAYAARHRDALPIFVPFAWLLNNNACTKPRVIAHDLPAPELIGGLPDYVFDPLWTRIGKRAVELFIRSHLMKPPFTSRMVAAALWNAESALCDRTLSWSMSDQLKNRAHAADLIALGLRIERHAELNDWIEREMPALTAARRAVRGDNQGEKAASIRMRMRRG